MRGGTLGHAEARWTAGEATAISRLLMLVSSRNPDLGDGESGKNSVIHYTFAIPNRAFNITSIKINGSAVSSLVAGAGSLLGRML